MRLFVAIPLPQSACQALNRAQMALLNQGHGHLIPQQNLHLTLSFIGESSNVRDAVTALSAIDFPSFEITVEGIGSFGDLYWAGVRPSSQLDSLQQRITQNLREAGFILESRDFLPHITLCRQYRSPTAPDIGTVQASLGSCTFKVRCLHLMESLRPGGILTYTPRFTIDLR